MSGVGWDYQAMRYLALLRGINVGGNNRVEMPRLKATFERLGHTEVSTYINTGNVIFEARKSPELKLASAIEAVIADEFGFPVRTLVRTKANIDAVTKDIPDHWANDKVMKSDVMFLWDEANSRAALDQLTVVPGIDEVIYSSEAVLWRVDRTHQSRSGMQQLVGTKFYKQMTIRNCNTVRAIASKLAQ